MKLLKLSFALILIESALLLNAGSESANLSEMPIPREIAKQHTQSPNKSDDNSQSTKNLATKKDIAKSHQKTTEQVTKQDKKESESIRVAPINVNPLYVNKDWADYVYVIFSLLLVIVGAFQARLLFWQFIADHRPRIKIRSVHIATDITELDPLYQHGFDISLVIVNWGASAARIVGAYVASTIDKPNNPEFMKKPLIEKSADSPVEIKWLKPAAEYVVKWKHPAKDGDVYNAFKAHSLQGNSPLRSLYIFGYFVYRDRRRWHYKTHFCRRFDAIGERFSPVDHPDYEYAD